MITIQTSEPKFYNSDRFEKVTETHKGNLVPQSPRYGIPITLIRRALESSLVPPQHILREGSGIGIPYLEQGSLEVNQMAGHSDEDPK